jgi:Transcriptional regulator, AbiEi antitoxin
MPDDGIRAVAELAASQHRALTRTQAAALNFDRRRVATAKRAGWLEEPTPGVLVLAGAFPTWHQRLMVAALAMGGHGVVSHRAAARLHGLDGFDYPGMAIVEASVTRRFRVDLPDAVFHHITPLEPCDVVSVDGIPCTAIGRTLADLGSVIRDRRRIGRALTDARRRRVDLLALRTTAERLHRPGQSGTGTLLRLLDGIPFEGRVPQTWFEELLALCLTDPALPEIVLQCPIRNQQGRIIARADIGMPAVKLGLEAHSREFHWGPIYEPLDEDRDIAAATCGWELIYLGWYATKRPAAVLRVVNDLVRTRKCELRVQESARTAHTSRERVTPAL